MNINDIQQLASQITVFLAPVLPLLMLTGTEATKEIGKNIGEETIQVAKNIWTTIGAEKLSNDEKIEMSAECIAKFPDDKLFQDRFGIELAKALQQQPKLAETLTAMLKNADKATQKVLVENQSKAEKISLKIHNALGEQDVKVIGGSTVGDINIEQG